MNDAILKELALRWEREIVTPDCQDGSNEAKIGNRRGKTAKTHWLVFIKF